MTLPTSWSVFDSIWCVDFEFTAPDGEQPVPIVGVARNLQTGTIIRMGPDELAAPIPPYGIGAADLVVGYFVSAECGCHAALGWSMPAWVLDLFAEFRRLTNGLTLPCGRGLLGACAYFGLPVGDAAEKSTMRELAMRGGPYTSEELRALLAYCENDVSATAVLFKRMQPLIDLPRALLRGRYMRAVAAMEHVGVPIDSPLLATLRASWADVKTRLIERVDQQYGVFDGTTFKLDLFEKFLTAHGIPWDRTEHGILKLDDQTFKERSRAFPILNPLRELRYSLAQLRLTDLAVGRDGRNRTLLSPFAAKTGRNAPSTSKFIFGPSTWLRSLIRPEPGWGLAYVDWSQQEFGIAAALSNDGGMWEAYESGDPYLATAKHAGVVPADATKSSHGGVREQFKTLVLGVQYGMERDSLARRLDQSPAHAAELLQHHRAAYPRFWQWSDSAVSFAMLSNQIHTTFGWTLTTSAQTNPRSLANFPVQANGAEMLRLACCLTTEAKIRVCAPVHDALLVEAPIDNLDATIDRTQAAMGAASRAVLGGLTLRSSVTRVVFPDRFADPRGADMFRTVLDVLPRTGHTTMDVPEQAVSTCV
jgi:hypothetical protein